MPKTNEALLSKALQSGDRDQINAVYESIYGDYSKLVSFAVARFISDPETVKDLTDDVFLAFFQNAEKVTGSIKYYLLQSAKNAALNRLKKEGKFSIAAGEDEIPDAASFQSASFYKDLIDDLQKNLSKKEVEIILLHVVDGYPFAEIGKKMGISMGSANVIYFRAIRKYRKLKKRSLK